MKIFIPLAFAFAITMTLIFMPPMMVANSTSQMERGAQDRIIPGSFIVTLKPEYVGASSVNDTNLSNDTLTKQEQRIAIKADEVNEQLKDQGGNVSAVYTRAINGFAVQGVSDLTPLIDDPAIQNIEPDIAEPVDAQYQSTGIGRIGLASAPTAAFRPDNRETKTDVDVAVIDTQVYDHPDLNIFRRGNFQSAGDPTLATHGTHVAGLCCAKDNLGGVVGPAQGARIWALRVCSEEPAVACSTSARLLAFDFIIDNAASIDVATMSCCSGSSGTSGGQGITNIVNAGIPFFQSAGNDDKECNDGGDCGNPNPIIVGSMTDYDGKCGGLTRPLLSDGSRADDDVYAAYSNYGSAIDIIAPGSSVLSTWPGQDTDIPVGTGGAYIGGSEQGRYARISGTSMATPLAAGVGALYLVKNPGWAPSTVKSTMQADGYTQTQSCAGGNAGTVAGSKGGFVLGANDKDSKKIIWAGNI